MEKTAEKLKVNESLLKTVLCSATFWGLLAHGMVLFNKYSFHDDVRYFNEVGATYESGRWMLGILGSLSANLLGSKNYSLPVVNGTITILCIAAIVYLLVDSLKIQSKPLVILLCGSMVTFPSVTGTIQLHVYCTILLCCIPTGSCWSMDFSPEKECCRSITLHGFDGLLCWCVPGKYPGLHLYIAALYDGRYPAV